MKRWHSLLLITTAAALNACSSSGSKYETAPYKVVRDDRAFQVREYPALAVASSPLVTDNTAFMNLFRYIGGQNDKQQEINMTTPVFMSDKQMNFVMPEKVRVAPPKPSNKDVALGTMPTSKRAVFRYSGFGSKTNADKALVKLRAWMASNKLAASGESMVAYYDFPFVLPWTRRNEVMVPIK